MKYIIIILTVFFMGTNHGKAQSCNYYYLQNNKTVEITIFDKKQRMSGKLIYKVSDVKKSGASVSSKVNSEILDKNGKLIGSGASTMQCSNGILKVDMKMMVPVESQSMYTADATGVSSYIEYPVSLSVGDKLPDANFSMDMNMNTGIKGHVDIDVTERMVIAKESITTPAGTWDAYKITSKQKMLIRMDIGIPRRDEVTEWYVPNFGVVKTQSKAGGTELTSIK
ncbi:MAG: hypothetical protein ABIW38_12045 [Ferruginibacter sp.]